MRGRSVLWALASALVLTAPPAGGASLTPTTAAFDRQLAGAEAQGFERARTADDVYSQVEDGDLVRLPGNRDYELKSTVSLPYARPELRLFVERLSAQYRPACGDKIVVTSLVRPKNHQPRNAHPQSVHQLGLAVDMRVSWRSSCRRWLEGTLLQLEGAGVIEASREHYPPHYHVVVFPDRYARYVEELEGERPKLAYGPVRPPQGEAAEIVTADGFQGYRYVVQAGDSLWSIAERYGVDLPSLRAANGLPSNTLRPGQTLKVPLGRPVSGGAQTALETYTVRTGDTLWTIAQRQHVATRAAAGQRAALVAHLPRAAPARPVAAGS
ncbi:MAG: DUF5715 family protein [Thermoanaerobaculia bacterium]